MKPTTLKPGDRVVAKDAAGVPFAGYLHHAQGQQFYVLPDTHRQPFYAFPSEIEATGDQQAGFVVVERPLGIDTVERQRVFVAHMHRRETP